MSQNCGCQAECLQTNCGCKTTEGQGKDPKITPWHTNEHCPLNCANNKSFKVEEINTCPVPATPLSMARIFL